MKLSLKDATAAIVRPDLEDCVYYFGEPDTIVRGGWNEWGVLEKELNRHQQTKKEGLHPQGAAVGYFSYDGSFEFYFHSAFSIGTTDGLWPSPGAVNVNPVEGWTEDSGRDQYEEMVRKAQDYISAGDIYQVNIARRLNRRLADFDSKAFFRHLWLLSGAPRSAYLNLGEVQVMSASPELFLAIDGRRIVTQPIKGTRPRSADPMQDQLNSFELSTDPKEIAELIMITDLERNDLGRICEYGSVHVSELVKQQTFSHVHHQHSTVEGELRENVSPIQAVRACFPGGSITGAPKKRAIEIIQELEPVPRGIFTGAIGYFGFDGSVRLNIAIRTAVHDEGLLHFHVGSGITAYSDPALEYAETSHKAAVILQSYATYAAATRMQERSL